MHRDSCKKCFLKLLGSNMFLFSLITIGLGIVDLILTHQQCVQINNCKLLTNEVVLRWVGVAIWAPIPIFFNGIAAIWIASRPASEKGWMCLLSFLNSIAFGPVIVVVTALELVNKFDNGTAPGVQTAMYIIEIIICVIGAILTLHAFVVMYLNCCCGTCLQHTMTSSPHHPRLHDSQAVVRGIENAPASHDIGRLNMWSAQRFNPYGKSVSSDPYRCAAVEFSSCNCACGHQVSAARPTLIFPGRN